MNLTLEGAEEAVAYWQGVLRLQDWNITVQIRRRTEMRGKDCYGEIYRDPTYRTANMYLLDPLDFAEMAGEDDKDMENTIVHELLHVHFYDCHVTQADGDDYSPEEIAEERAIDALAAAFVKLNRKG